MMDVEIKKTSPYHKIIIQYVFYFRKNGGKYVRFGYSKR